MVDKITEIKVFKGYSESNNPGVISVIKRGHEIAWICRDGELTNLTDWEIDPGPRFWFGLEYVTREAFMDLLMQNWPEDFNAILWHPEMLDCEYQDG